MKNLPIRTDQKLAMIIEQSSMGLAEIDSRGTIIQLNPKGESLLKPIFIAHSISKNNLFDVLDHIAPSLTNKIHSSADEPANIVSNEIHSFSLSFGGESIERHFNFTVNKMYSDCIIVGFDDITSNRQKEEAIQQLLIEKSVIQGKFEIASNILHDIGNALVGFGSYIGRIKRSMEQSQVAHMQKLGDFFSSRQDVMTTAFGENKSEALLQMFSGLIKAQNNNDEEIQKSVTEQLNIITHIQEIMNIQRRYNNGHDSQEKQPLNLRNIINDCLSMLVASVDKRGIKVTINAPEKLPAIMGDRTQLMQVILNILKNSIEAIDIAAAEKSIGIAGIVYPDHFEIKIQDNGHGFDKATGYKLFERGFTTKASGSGIGLSHCRAIVENHDATITISSPGFGKGSQTTIKFKI
jgi:signal transduction histidine kinase